MPKRTWSEPPRTPLDAGWSYSHRNGLLIIFDLNGSEAMSITAFRKLPVPTIRLMIYGYKEGIEAGTVAERKRLSVIFGKS